MEARQKKAFAVGVAAMAAALLVGSAVAGPGKPAKRLVRGVHAEISLIKANGATDAFVVDRGEVTAETQTSFSLERKDGASVTLQLGADSKVRGDIQVGKGAVAFSRGGTAFLVLAPRAKAAPVRFGHGKGPGDIERFRARGLRGVVHADVKVIRADASQDAFSFDRGEVTAASSSSVTVKRADGPSVTKSGKLAVGGRAAVFSRGSAAFTILATGPRA